MSQAPCGTRAAIVAHLQFGEPLDGPCALAELAFRVEAERARPTPPKPEPTPNERLIALNAEALDWELEHPGMRRASLRVVS